MNIDCSLFINNKIYIHEIFSKTKICQLITFLLVKNIENIIYNFNEYIVVDLFINNYIKEKEKKQSIIDRFSIEIHIVNDFKTNLLLKNNVLKIQQISINIDNQITILINCRKLIISININFIS